jgi:hypothetical protein
MRARRLRFWPLFAAALWVACDDGTTPPPTTPPAADGGNPTDTGVAVDAGNPDTSPPPQGDGGLAPCLDLPTELERPPSGRLPCDLLPPGFVAP